LFLLFAIGAFFFALTTTHAGLLWLALAAALACLLLWVRGLYRARAGNAFAAVPRPLHPAELQTMREQLRAAAPANPSPERQPLP